MSSEPQTPDEALIGETIGNYRIVRKIGQGAMGSVWEAAHTRMERRVALKLLSSEACDRSELIERFFAEARVVSALSHEHIVKAMDWGQAQRGHYITMELLQGESLRQRLSRLGPLDVPTAVAITDQIACALGAAHEIGIVHRDVKPENVFLTMRDDGTECVKILDFGVAKLAAGWNPTVETRAGALLGTPYYMPPEQIAGGKVDERSDVYALGVVLFEILTDQLPFYGQNFCQLAVKQIEQAPPRIRSLKSDVPMWLDEIVHRALAKRPEDRFASMEELRQALTHGLDFYANEPTYFEIPLWAEQTRLIRPVKANLTEEHFWLRHRVAAERSPQGESSRRYSRVFRIALATAVGAITALAVFEPVSDWVTPPHSAAQRSDIASP